MQFDVIIEILTMLKLEDTEKLQNLYIIYLSSKLNHRYLSMIIPSSGLLAV